MNPIFVTHNERGIPQLIAGILWAVLALTMFWRSHHKYGFTWPVRWTMLVSFALIAVAYSLILHGAYWLGWTRYPVDSWRMVLPLYVQMVLVAWLVWRWARDDYSANNGREDERNHDSLHDHMTHTESEPDSPNEE